MDIKNKNIAVSWSGGKDSCLSLFRAMQEGGVVKALFTMFEETGVRSRAHALSRDILEAQAASLGVPLITRNATWESYTDVFIAALKEIKASGIGIMVFGDIDVEPNRQWVIDTCQAAGIIPYHPIWKADRKSLLFEFINKGFQARIAVAKDQFMPPELIGRIVDNALVEEISGLNIDACGEEGEFHSVVTGGPIFSKTLDIVMSPQKILRNGRWYPETITLNQ